MGLQAVCTSKVDFMPGDRDSPVFGFLDSSLVIRRSHFIPVFVDGGTNQLLSKGISVARLPGNTDDWAGYYVNM